MPAPGADARVRQNLALVVGLQGRFAEAETIVKADLPPDEAAANVAYLKQMLSRKDKPRTAQDRPVAALDRRTDSAASSPGDRAIQYSLRRRGILERLGMAYRIALSAGLWRASYSRIGEADASRRSLTASPRP